MFAQAVAVAARALGDGRDGRRELFLTHALLVAQALGPEATAAELSTAVLHDVLEDSDWTIDDLASSGVEATVCQAVETLTRLEDENYEDFIARVCATRGIVGIISQRVKLADLTVNIEHPDSVEERERHERSLPIVRRALEGNLDFERPR